MGLGLFFLGVGLVFCFFGICDGKNWVPQASLCVCFRLPGCFSTKNGTTGLAAFLFGIETTQNPGS